MPELYRAGAAEGNFKPTDVTRLVRGITWSLLLTVGDYISF